MTTLAAIVLLAAADLRPLGDAPIYSVQFVDAREGWAAGADGVVVTPPFYAITGPMEVERHFRAIAAGTSLPVWAYDIPVCTHVKLLPEALMVLASEGLLAGVKDSSGDDVAFRRLAQRFLGPQLGPQLVDVEETGPLYLGALR